MLVIFLIAASPIIINGIILRIGIVQEFNNGGELRLLAASRLKFDFENLDGNSFQFGGIVSYWNDINEVLNLGFGAMYNLVLFGPYLVPLFLFARQRLFGNLFIEGMAGRTFGRSYTQY